MRKFDVFSSGSRLLGECRQLRHTRRSYGRDLSIDCRVGLQKPAPLSLDFHSVHRSKMFPVPTESRAIVRSWGLSGWVNSGAVTADIFAIVVACRRERSGFRTCKVVKVWSVGGPPVGEVFSGYGPACRGRAEPPPRRTGYTPATLHGCHMVICRIGERGKTK